VESVARAITLVIVPPEGGVCYSHVYLVWSEGMVRLSLPLSPFLKRGKTDEGDELFLGPSGIVSTQAKAVFVVGV
jgi:hypothetical protein